MTTFDATSDAIGPPLHLWKFESATPGTEPDVGSDPDSSMFSGSGTYSARSVGPLQDGTTNYAVQFTDGDIRRAKAIASNDWGGTTDGSISFWFKSGSATTQVLWGDHPDNKAFRFFLFSDGTLQFQVISGSLATNCNVTGTNYADNAWHFCVIVCNGTTANKIYMDGEAVTVTFTYTGAGLTDHPWIGSITGSVTVDFHVGNDSRAPGTDNFPFVGLLSRLAFWASPLSADDVYELYQSAFGLGGLPAGTPKVPLPLSLPMTNSVYMAQRLAYRKLLEGQRQRFLSVIANLRALQWVVGDVLTVTLADLNINAETFRITSLRTSREPGRIDLGLIADDASAYADPANAIYVQPSTMVQPVGGQVQIPRPTGLTAAASLEGVQLTWTPPGDPLPVVYYEVWASASSAWSGASLIGQTAGTTFFHAQATTATKWYWVRAIDASGNASNRSPDSDTSTVTATFTAGTTAVPSAPQSLGGIDGTPATGQLTGTFQRAGVTVASRIFTATHSGGNLTYSAAADTGEATTHSATGSGTPTLVVTHRHTGSGQTTTLTFTVA
jgi:hypothetical protein